MALLKFFEGKESSYSSSSHSGGLYFAKDTGVILFKGVKYGSKPGVSNCATKLDIISLQTELAHKAESIHEHTMDDISDLIIANSDHDGLMSSNDKMKLDKSINSIYLLQTATSVNQNLILRYYFNDSKIVPELGGKPNGGLVDKPNGSEAVEKFWTIDSATQVQSGLMSADDKKKLDSLANTLQALSVQPLNNSSEISPASLIGSDRYDILKGITDKHIGVNAQFTDGKLTIGLYDFNKSEWVGAPSVTIPLQ